MALWDVYQQIEISNLKAGQRGAEAAARGRHEGLRDEVWRLEDRIERLLVVTDALWELASEALGLTDDQLTAKVVEVDARSGAVDGRRARVIRRCPTCDAAIAHGRPTCAFCGAGAPGGHPLDQV